DTALSVICHQYISPPILTKIMVIVIITTIDEKISKPMRKKVTIKIATSEIPILLRVSGHMVNMLVILAEIFLAAFMDS
ncbi:GSCOCG00010664001-RA-CDS, partial [Cotesia congregata]